jgi:hypothetical protein
LEEARFLIEEKKQKPADIYLDLGFEDITHFYFVFKRNLGQLRVKLMAVEESSATKVLISFLFYCNLVKAIWSKINLIFDAC